jgi:FKBP-type peptidyl-prolyl cis-trans isomerase FklB
MGVASAATPQTAATAASSVAAAASSNELVIGRVKGTLPDPKDRLSYTYGVQTARSLLKNDTTYDLDMLIRGLQDALDGRQLLLSEREMNAAMSDMQVKIQRRLASDRMNLGAKNKIREESFLADYRKTPGVQVLTGNVMVKPIKTGTGTKPAEEDTIAVNFRATLLDGTEYDVTEVGKPQITRVADQVMGLKTALKMMPAGSIWEVIVPAALAYGERGINGKLAPNETFRFMIELVAVRQQQ